MSATSRAPSSSCNGLLCVAAIALFFSDRALRADSTRSDDEALRPQIRRILVDGERAPGLPDGLTIREIQSEPPIISANGVVLFAAFLDGDEITSHNDGVLYAARDGKIELIARENRPVGKNNEVMAGMRAWSIGPDDQVLVLAGEPADLWFGPSGRLRLVARSAGPVPGSHVAFPKNIQAFARAGEDLAIVSASDGAYLLRIENGSHELRAVIRADDRIEGVKVQSWTLSKIAGGSDGTFWWTSDWQRDGFQHLFANTAGESRLMLQTKAQLAEAGEGVRLMSIASLEVSQAGEVCIAARTDDAYAFGWALYAMKADGSRRLLAKGRQRAANRPERLERLRFDDAIAINAHGEALFCANALDGKSALWLARPDELVCVASVNDEALGASPGARIAQVNLNRADDVAFGMSYVTDASIDALHAGSLDSMSVIARRGESLEYGGENLGKVQQLFLYAGGSGSARGSALSDDGRLVFKATFESGTSGIFVVQLPKNGP